MESVSVICLPREDVPFATLVKRVLRDLPDSAAGAHLQRELRLVYPRAVVRPESRLAPVGGSRSLRYAYRDADTVAAEERTWADDPGIPEGAFDADGIYREANAALCDLFGVPSPDAIVGHDWSEFATPESIDAADRLWAELAAARIDVMDAGITSTYHVCRADGSVAEIEYRTVWDPHNDVFRTRMRRIRVAQVDPHPLTTPAR